MARYVGLILLFFAFVLPAQARNDFPTSSQAFDKCMSNYANRDGDPHYANYDWFCTPESPNWIRGYTINRSTGDKTSDWQYSFGGEFPSCSAGESVKLWIDGTVDTGLARNGMCSCVFSRIATWGEPYNRMVGNCVNDGEFVGSGGGAGTDLPQSPMPPPPCGGGSCYDAPNNQFCMSDESGHQTCVSGPRQSGPDAGKTPPACGVFNGRAICVGTPNAAKPQGDPEPPVTDHQVVETSDGQGGDSYTTIVNVHNTSGVGNNRNPGDGTSNTGSTGNMGDNGSEGKADSDGRCADGSVPSASGCGAGYADRGCDAPPTCSGDPLMCAALREQHATRCAAAERYADATDTGKAASTLDGMGMVGPEGTGIPSRSDVIEEVSLGGEGGQGSGMDDSGWGWSRSCPIESREFTLLGQSVTIDYGQACGALSLGGVLVMLMAYLAAARIVVMGSN